ncbi:hypothetical protein OKW30_007567 [Paraburkholderia sp. Clong3]
MPGRIAMRVIHEVRTALDSALPIPAGFEMRCEEIRAHCGCKYFRERRHALRDAWRGVQPDGVPGIVLCLTVDRGSIPERLAMTVCR